MLCLYFLLRHKIEKKKKKKKKIGYLLSFARINFHKCTQSSWNSQKLLPTKRWFLRPEMDLGQVNSAWIFRFYKFCLFCIKIGLMIDHVSSPNF